MKDAIAKVKGAVARKDIVPQLTHYFVHEGMITASDGNLTASAPFPSEETFLVPAKDFDRILDRFDDDAEIVVSADSVTIKAGRYRGKIKTLDPKQYTFNEPVGDEVVVTEGLLRGLRIASAFTRDSGVHLWSAGVQLDGGCAWATNNTSLVCVKEIGVKQKLLIPSAAIDFILDHPEELTSMRIDENSASFIWSDGHWMRTQLLVGEFPKKAQDMLLNGEAPTWEIPEDWRVAYQTVTELSEDFVRFYADWIIGGSGAAEISAELSTPVPANNDHSTWQTKNLDPVIAHASHWQPDAWPETTRFIGDGLIGLMASRGN